MTSRSYALILIVGAATLFLGLAATNVVLDPWWVFRVSPLRRSAIHVNDRYDFYRAYVLAPNRYDAVLLSSSRGLQFSLDDLARYANGDRYARFSVSFGRLADHLAVLEFVLRDKAARGSRLKDVFLLIDIDSFGLAPHPPDELQLLQPPAISREPAFRFWWKNLTAVQTPAWKRAVEDAGIERGAMNALSAAAVTSAHALPRPAVMRSAFVTPARPLPAQSSSAMPAPPRPTPIALSTPAERVTVRPRYEDDMHDWARIVALCRENDVRLFAAVAPLAPEILAWLDAADAEKVAEQISRVAPVWDFSAPYEPSNTPDLWYGPRHFHPSVAQMVLGRMYGTEVPAEWRNFGRLRGAAGVSAR